MSMFTVPTKAKYAVNGNSLGMNKSFFVKIYFNAPLQQRFYKRKRSMLNNK